MERKVLITEPAEPVATEVLAALLALGIPVRAVAEDAVSLVGAEGPEMETAVVDYRDPDNLTELFRGITDACFCLPFAPDIPDMVRNLSSAARAFEVGHIVYESVLGADAPSTVIGRWHQKAEQYVKSSGISFTFLRPNFIMQDFISREGEEIRDSGRISLPLGDARISWIDARDVAACAVECLTRGTGHGMGYTLTGPEAISLGEAAQILSGALDREIRYEPATLDEARSRMAHAGFPGWLIDAHLDRLERYRFGRIGEVVTASVREITGKPPRRFHEFAEEYAERWFASIAE